MNDRYSHSNTPALFHEMEPGDNGSGLLSEFGLTAQDAWAEQLQPRARPKPGGWSMPEVRNRSRNISWFLGLYTVSLLTFTGVVGSVR